MFWLHASGCRRFLMQFGWMRVAVMSLKFMLKRRCSQGQTSSLIIDLTHIFTVLKLQSTHSISASNLSLSPQPSIFTAPPLLHNLICISSKFIAPNTLLSHILFHNQVTTLGLDLPWKGGDMNFQGGGYKINLLKEAIEPYKSDENRLVMFTDR